MFSVCFKFEFPYPGSDGTWYLNVDVFLDAAVKVEGQVEVRLDTTAIRRKKNVTLMPNNNKVNFNITIPSVRQRISMNFALPERDIWKKEIQEILNKIFFVPNDADIIYMHFSIVSFLGRKVA